MPRLIVLSLALAALAVAPPATARQLALVIGIDRYQHAEHPDLPPLRGAINDARGIAAALRRSGADLPPQRLLLGPQATRAGLDRAWADLLAHSGPGDSLIVSFAGHGGQELERAPPFDEADHKDETLLLWDFDPAQPYLGRLNDDELYAWLKAAAPRRVLLVADACYSGGLVRGLDRPHGVARGGHTWGVDLSAPTLPPRPALEGERWERLAHVLYVTGTENDRLKVWETEIDGQPHGALSWGFAQAIGGAADRNGNGVVSRRELEDYLAYQVPRLTSQRQNPRFLPRGGADAGQDLLALASPVLPPPSPAALPITVAGGQPPPGLHGVRPTTDAALLFRLEGGRARVYQDQDQVTAIATADAAAWQRLVDKYRLLAAIDAAYNPRRAALAIHLREGDGRHPLGTRLHFSFAPGEGQRADHLILFDLAGDGTLQLLYPLPKGLNGLAQDDPPRVALLPYALPLETTPPGGADDLVALFCSTPQPRLLGQLAGTDRPPEPAAFLGAVDTGACQLGRYRFFTAPGGP